MAYGSVATDQIQTSDGLSLGAGNATLLKNKLINGACVIDQRNNGASQSYTSAPARTYCVDRFAILYSANSKLTTQQNAGSVTPPAGFTNYLGITSASAYSVSSSDYFALTQLIEGYNVADLGWGTANAKTITVSAWIYSSLTGTFGGAIQNNAGNYSYPFTYTISSANTWTQISVTIAGPTSGTWLTNSSVGLYLSFGLGVGSTYSGTAGSWSSNNYVSATGAVSVVGTSGATWYATGFQLERGSSATGFEYRQYGQELALCQRYYETQALVGNYSGLNQGGYAYLSFNFAVQKRTAPTMTYASMTYISNGTGGTGFTPNISSSTVNQFYVGSNGFSNFNGLGTGTANASAEL